MILYEYQLYVPKDSGVNWPQPIQQDREEPTWDQRMCNGWKVPGAIIMTCRKFGENVLYMAFQNEKNGLLKMMLMMLMMLGRQLSNCHVCHFSCV